MHAQLYANGKVEIYDDNDELLHSGIPGKEKGEEGFNAFINFAVALMQYHGDWPDSPIEDCRVELKK